MPKVWRFPPNSGEPKVPQPSKFVAERKTEALRARRLGASDRTCAAAAGVDHKTLGSWLEKGREADEGSPYRDFFDAWEGARAQHIIRHLENVEKHASDKPDLSWRLLERFEEGFAPPAPQLPTTAGPVLIQLAFVNGQPSGEGTVIDVPESPTRPRRLSAASTEDRGKAS
jgi:hypothetical protein